MRGSNADKTTKALPKFLIKIPLTLPEYLKKIYTTFIIQTNIHYHNKIRNVAKRASVS